MAKNATTSHDNQGRARAQVVGNCPVHEQTTRIQTQTQTGPSTYDTSNISTAILVEPIARPPASYHLFHVVYYATVRATIRTKLVGIIHGRYGVKQAI